MTSDEAPDEVWPPSDEDLNDEAECLLGISHSAMPAQEKVEELKATLLLFGIRYLKSIHKQALDLLDRQVEARFQQMADAIPPSLEGVTIEALRHLRDPQTTDAAARARIAALARDWALDLLARQREN